MAGYIINLDNIKSLYLYIQNGVYSTKLSTPSGYWRINHEGTFADYITMNEGDNIFFFIKRKIYGIGELVNVEGNCKYCNYPEACIPKSFNYKKINKLLLWDEDTYSADQRWVCFFKPSPFFFDQGIDMDDVLSSDPSSFRMLRAFWKVSFLKLDDDENQSLKNVILKFNQDYLLNRTDNSNIISSNYCETHKFISKKLVSKDYNLNISSFLSSCADENYLKHEMALESGILYQLSNEYNATLNIFGSWDYLSHQVVASPFKPVDYMDKMDIFGFSYIPGFKPTKSKYIVIENKKDSCGKDEIDQLLKYVDWVKDEYCFGDYSMIKSFLVAYDFDKDVIEYKRKYATRYYTIGRRPAKSLIWEDLSLIRYEYDNKNEIVKFNKIA